MAKIHRNLTLSFTGKRDNPRLENLPVALKELFEKLDTVFSYTHFHLLTGLADGADQIAADTFAVCTKRFGAERHNKWTMGAVMAFNKADYLHTIDNQEEFNRLYELTGQKLHLDGIYVAGAEGERYRANAHRQQGQVLARFGDLLIAAAPRGERGKAGGTSENIVAALEKGRPVVFYDLDGGRYYLYRKVSDWFSDTEGPKDAPEIGEKLEGIFVVRKDDKNTAKSKVTNGGDAKAEEKKDQHSLSEGEEKEGLIDRMVENRWLMNTLFILRKAVWNWFEGFFKKKNRENTTPKVGQEAFGPLYDTIKKRRKDISDQANEFQMHYRGSYMLNYFVSALAIFIATVAIAYYIYMVKYWPGVSAGGVLIILGVCKMTLIALVILNTREANKHNYNRRAIDFRYASERLKFNQYLSFAGVFNPVKPTLGQHSQNYLENNPGELQYEEELSRLKTIPYTLTLSSEPILQSLDFLKHEWYQGQSGYHTREPIKYNNLHHGLETLAEGLSLTVLGIVALEVVLKWVEPLVSPGTKSLFGAVGPILLALAVFLPALVIILISINFQTESKKLTARYEAVRKRVDDLLKELETADSTIRVEAKGSIFINVLEHLDEMGTLMIDEVADWSIFYENKVYET